MTSDQQRVARLEKEVADLRSTVAALFATVMEQEKAIELLVLRRRIKP